MFSTRSTSPNPAACHNVVWAPRSINRRAAFHCPNVTASTRGEPSPITAPRCFNIRNGRSAGFNAPFRNPATVGRLEFAGIRRLTLRLSGYSGVSSSDAVKITPRASIASFDTKTRELNTALERLSGSNLNIAKQLLGYYVEPALHSVSAPFAK